MRCYNCYSIFKDKFNKNHCSYCHIQFTNNMKKKEWLIIIMIVNHVLNILNIVNKENIVMKIINKNYIYNIINI
jgi:hypothetical protein